MRTLHAVLRLPPSAPEIVSRAAWWERHRAATAGVTSPLEQAILGGFAADRIGYAFGSGYQAALRALVPSLPPDALAAFCVTERGGGHPRAVEARLDEIEPGRHRLAGKKRWATLGEDADVLFVVASAGDDERGRKRLRVARIPSRRAGVSRRPMPETPFTPEIVHAEIDLVDVEVGEDELLPGDGHVAWARPFRTLEDIHVQAAVLAYALREARAHDLPRPLAERLAALLAGLHPVAAADPDHPATHVALAGLIEAGGGALDELERAFALTGSPAHARWLRDRPLLTVAGGARAQRLAKAWEALGRSPA